MPASSHIFTLWNVWRRNRNVRKVLQMFLFFFLLLHSIYSGLCCSLMSHTVATWTTQRVVIGAPTGFWRECANQRSSGIFEEGSRAELSASSWRMTCMKRVSKVVTPTYNCTRNVQQRYLWVTLLLFFSPIARIIIRQRKYSGCAVTIVTRTLQGGQYRGSGHLCKMWLIASPATFLFYFLFWST